eukprot:scpid52703/ scgid18839/ 
MENADSYSLQTLSHHECAWMPDGTPCYYTDTISGANALYRYHPRGQCTTIQIPSQGPMHSGKQLCTAQTPLPLRSISKKAFRLLCATGKHFQTYLSANECGYSRWLQVNSYLHYFAEYSAGLKAHCFQATSATDVRRNSGVTITFAQLRAKQRIPIQFLAATNQTGKESLRWPLRESLDGVNVGKTIRQV